MTTIDFATKIRAIENQLGAINYKKDKTDEALVRKCAYTIVGRALTELDSKELHEAVSIAINAPKTNFRTIHSDTARFQMLCSIVPEMQGLKWKIFDSFGYKPKKLERNLSEQEMIDIVKSCDLYLNDLRNVKVNHDYRGTESVMRRQAYIYLLKVVYGDIQYARLGRLIAIAIGRTKVYDHATCLHSVKKVSEMLEVKDRQFLDIYEPAKVFFYRMIVE